ncbi:hypothetical protein [Homoserinimonas hongtaonis]|nr:hypothetical protein [Salinibacterium hongtaonis]
MQRVLVHASAAVTLDTHGDLFDDDLEIVAARTRHAKRVRAKCGQNTVA